MGDGRLANLVQVTNQKIEFLNSHLDEYGVNRFYKVPPNNIRKDHIKRMIHDLDFLIANSDVDSSDIEDPYLNVREKLMEIKNHLAETEESSDHSAER